MTINKVEKRIINLAVRQVEKTLDALRGPKKRIASIYFVISLAMGYPVYESRIGGYCTEHQKNGLLNCYRSIEAVRQKRLSKNSAAVVKVLLPNGSPIFLAVSGSGDLDRDMAILLTLTRKIELISAEDIQIFSNNCNLAIQTGIASLR